MGLESLNKIPLSPEQEERIYGYIYENRGTFFENGHISSAGVSALTEYLEREAFLEYSRKKREEAASLDQDNLSSFFGHLESLEQANPYNPKDANITPNPFIESEVGIDDNNGKVFYNLIINKIGREFPDQIEAMKNQLAEYAQRPGVLLEAYGLFSLQQTAVSTGGTPLDPNAIKTILNNMM